ncbi:MAG TPA: 5-formyltetrahydrofolate cyclo-ligase [Candidatus Methanomethylia archaeon]|nr:5-formyltetrahydrofolate cyclo-ligase [Candidatus Methanomethylicia archaeon]
MSGYKPSKKEEIRQRIWRLLEEKRVALPPKPIYGRIPNFMGAERAALKLSQHPVFAKAKVIKVNPDSPQREVRRLALLYGKLLIMPTPRLRRGFIFLDPARVRDIDFASTIKGAFMLGRIVGLKELKEIVKKADLIVAGSVAVTPYGARVGKGGGYSEMEYAVLREMELVDEKTPIVTTVHDLQLVDELPFEDHDIPIDVVVTPTRILETHTNLPRPPGVIWSKVTAKMLDEISVLKELQQLGREKAR